MTLFRKLFTCLGLLVMMFAVYTAPVHAAAADGGGGGSSQQSCDKYDGQTLQIDRDKKKISAYKSSCDGSSCSSKNVKDHGKKAIKITCKDNDNGGSSGGGGGSSGGTDDTSSSEDVADPALDPANQCSAGNCSIISNYVNPLIKTMNVLVGIAIVIGIIFGAIQIIYSAGDPQKNASGRGHIRNALVALVAYLLFYGFLSFIIPGGISS